MRSQIFREKRSFIFPLFFLQGVSDSLRISETGSGPGNGNSDVFMSLFDSQHGLVRNDRLLTDGIMVSHDPHGSGTSSSAASEASTSPLPSSATLAFGASLSDALTVGAGSAPVKTEHSYSMAGSDGDSLPDSPLSNPTDGKHVSYSIFTQGAQLANHNSGV